MSRTKPTNTTKRTSRPNRKRAWKTTWQDTPGVRHHALAQVTKDPYLVNVFTPCTGYIGGAYNNTGTDMAVTCLPCLHSRFADQCDHMNIEIVVDLTDDALLDHFLEHDAMSIAFEP